MVVVVVGGGGGRERREPSPRTRSKFDERQLFARELRRTGAASNRGPSAYKAKQAP